MSETSGSLQDEVAKSWSAKSGYPRAAQIPKPGDLSELGLYKYIPNADFKLGLQRVILVALLCLGSSILLWQCCVISPTMQHALFSFFKWLLIPIKPLLVATPIDGVGGIVSFVTAISYAVNLLIVPIAAFLAVKAAEAPFYLYVANNRLFVLERGIGQSTPIGAGSRGQIGIPPNVMRVDRIFYIIRSYTNLEPDTRVQLERPKGKKSTKDYVLTFTSTTSETFKLRWGDIPESNDRSLFFEKLESKYRALIAPEVLEPFRPMINRQSYTELWLRELSDAPKRDKLTPLAPGAVLDKGNYTIINKAGVGGQGTAYFAHSIKHARTDSDEVVLKEYVLPVYPDVRVRKKAAERFQAEASMLKRLNHPQIAQFIDLFVEDHRAYVVMELVEGQTLKSMVANEGPATEKFVIDLAAQILDILVYLHSQQPPVIHRDLTPDNIMLSGDSQAKLIDFSVAQEASSGVTGSVVGKPNYIAPEQFRGKPTTQSDIYSLGATMYYLLIGHDPSPISVLHPQRANPAISEKLDAIVSRCTQPDVTKRFADAEQVLTALREI